MMLTAALLLAAQGSPTSTEVNPDRTVTFRYRDAAAAKVVLNLEGSPPIDMAKGENGIWTATTKPLEPDYYGYSFLVDNDTRLDTRNPNFKPNLIWQSNLLLVPGNGVWETRNVPHGTLHRHYYHSLLIGDERDMVVYTPPGYKATDAKKYPVLYLLHGFSDTSIGWTEVGKAHVILDNLIAEKKAAPMVVVMPLGYGLPNFHNGKATMPGQDFWKSNVEIFSKALMTEVLPMVEKEYRISTRSTDRAIAGLSMGGLQTLNVTMSLCSSTQGFQIERLLLR
ncbi:MAG: esterase [Verrucomicrobiaceae bacterium]|nr:MAG: esterase [Verrucomicrobiaceae bacterium]